MSAFDNAAKRLIHKHGVSCVYVNVTTGTYNTATGTVTNTEVETTITAYPKQIRITSYNYPNLIGKKVTEFLIAASDINFTPKKPDKIKMNNEVYSVEAVVDIVADGVATLYKVLAVKG